MFNIFHERIDQLTFEKKLSHSKNGDFPIKNGDFPIKNGDVPITVKMVIFHRFLIGAWQILADSVMAPKVLLQRAQFLQQDAFIAVPWRRHFHSLTVALVIHDFMKPLYVSQILSYSPPLQKKTWKRFDFLTHTYTYIYMCVYIYIFQFPVVYRKLMSSMTLGQTLFRNNLRDAARQNWWPPNCWPGCWRDVGWVPIMKEKWKAFQVNSG